jgi:hypothetical protein
MLASMCRRVPHVACALSLLALVCPRPSRTVVAAVGVDAGQATAGSEPRVADLSLPNVAGSVKFAAIGDGGTGEAAQYEVAQQMARWHARFPYDFVIMLGDNLYGTQGPEDFVTKFERPYQPLLAAGVRFFAALGNSDDQRNRFYAAWNMDGRRYYTYARDRVRFFVLDSTDLDPAQMDWIADALSAAREDWKICYFHHPLYSDGVHGPQGNRPRAMLEPLLLKYGVDAVYSGHDHLYERLEPQHGIHYFVSGAAGQLRRGDLRPSAWTAAGFDDDQSFMINEIVGDDLHFQVVTRTGRTVDAGRFHRHGSLSGQAPSTAVQRGPRP